MDKLEFDEIFNRIYKTLRLKVIPDHIYKLYNKVCNKMGDFDQEEVIRMIIHIMQKTEYDDFDDIKSNFELEFELLKLINFDIFQRGGKSIKISTNDSLYRKELFEDSGRFGVVTSMNSTNIVKWYVNPNDRSIRIPGEFLKEVAILKCLNHPNIVNIRGVIVTEKIVGIIMEKLQLSLYDIISSGKQVPRYRKQIRDCLDYMHSKNIYHHDIHESNIMFDTNMKPKLIDFNLASICDNSYPEYELLDKKMLKQAQFLG